MLRIGEFSKICQASIKALRHWDAIDLLKPAYTDPHTGYRYYSIEQIGDVNRLLALRTIGLSLQEVAHLLQENPTSDDIRALLNAKRQALSHQIQEAEAMLAALEGRLRLMDSASTFTPYEVTLKSSEPMQVLAVRTIVPDLEALVNLLQVTHPYARRKDNTNLLAVFHDEGYESELMDVEVGFPFAGERPKSIPLENDLHMRPAVLAGVPLLACTVHHGQWLTLPEAYVRLGRWIDQSGYTICGAGREIFHLIDWEGHQRDTVTELQFPVKRTTKLES
jgi:DNA-binding transcriptional MerR regulator/effector-binding domain-containing protein